MKFSHQDIIQSIKRAISTIDPSAEVHLFGSRARGDAKEDSDWDILVLVDKDVDRIQSQAPYREAILQVMTETDQVISTFIRNKDKWNTLHRMAPLFHEVEREGVLL